MKLCNMLMHARKILEYHHSVSCGIKKKQDKMHDAWSTAEDDMQKMCSCHLQYSFEGAGTAGPKAGQEANNVQGRLKSSRQNDANHDRDQRRVGQRLLHCPQQQERCKGCHCRRDGAHCLHGHSNTLA